MRSVALLLGSLLCLGSLGGCQFYFGGGGDDLDGGTCQWGGEPIPPGTDRPTVSDLRRDPTTGLCVDVGGGGGGGCTDPCQPCYPPPLPPGTAAVPVPPPPTWGLCQSACTGLDENSCLGAYGCRAAYLEGWDEQSGQFDPSQRRFSECWAVDQQGPVQGGGCEQLDAWSCSLHDDCIAIHDDTCDGSGTGTAPGGNGSGEADEAPGAPACGLGNFLLCAPEPPNNQIGCYSDVDCPSDTRCNASEICLPPPGSGMDGGTPVPVCYGYCVPNGVDRGSCWEPAACDAAPPVCPPNSVPGVRDGCYTGYCIELSACEPYPCSWLDENACVARPECTPYYQGVDCTCDADGNCICNDWVFTSCQ